MRIIILFPLLLALVADTKADNQPPILDCTGTEGADARTVSSAQKAGAKHLGEQSHEKTLRLDMAGKVTIEMVLIPSGTYFRGEGKSATLITLTLPLWVDNAFRLYDMGGNAWDSYARTCNATARSASTETYAGSQFGFRLARAVVPLDSKKPTIEIIDTHTHFYDPSRKEGIPWPGKGDKLLYRVVLPDEFEKLSKPHGVIGTVVVEASPRIEDNQWLLDLAAKEKVIVGVVGRLDPASDDFEKNLRRFAANPLFRGIRVNHNEVKAGLKGNLVERCKLLADLGLTLDINGGPDMPAAVALLAAKQPKLRIVINHAANLKIDGKEPPRAWRDGMAAAAQCPNVFCKVSALVEQTGQKDAPREVKYYRPVLDTLWNLFGEDRLLFGSNWPVSTRPAPYEVVVGIVRDYTSEKGEKAAAKFFLGNSQAAYGWRKR